MSGPFTRTVHKRAQGVPVPHGSGKRKILIAFDEDLFEEISHRAWKKRIGFSNELTELAKAGLRNKHVVQLRKTGAQS